MKNVNISLLVPSLPILYFFPTFHFAVPLPRSLFSVLVVSHHFTTPASSFPLPSPIPVPPGEHFTANTRIHLAFSFLFKFLNSTEV